MESGTGWAGYVAYVATDWASAIATIVASGKRVSCFVEHHQGLGGWVGAVGSLIAIGVTWWIANSQRNADKKEKLQERDRFVNIVLRITDSIDEKLSKFFRNVRDGQYEHEARYSISVLNSAEMRAAADISTISIRDWPSIDSYLYYRTYFYIINQSLQAANNSVNDSSHLSDLKNLIEQHDNVVNQLRGSLRAVNSRRI